MVTRNHRRRTGSTSTGKTQRGCLPPVTTNWTLLLVVAVLFCLTLPLVILPTPRVSASDVDGSGIITGWVRDSESRRKINYVDIVVYEYDAEDLDNPVGGDCSGGLFIPNGKYTVEDLPTGDYKVWFSGGMDHCPQWYNDRAGFDEADVIHVEDGDTTQIDDAYLDRGGRIKGFVADSDTCEGIGNVIVNVYDAEDPISPVDPGVTRVAGLNHNPNLKSAQSANTYMSGHIALLTRSVLSACPP